MNPNVERFSPSVWMDVDSDPNVAAIRRAETIVLQAMWWRRQ